MSYIAHLMSYMEALLSHIAPLIWGEWYLEDLVDDGHVAVVRDEPRPDPLHGPGYASPDQVMKTTNEIMNPTNEVIESPARVVD